jgi:dihydropteroate synthase
MSERIYLNPVHVTGAGSATESALPLAGGPLRFGACEVATRPGREPAQVKRETLSIPDLVRVEGARDWLAALSAPRPKLDTPEGLGGLDLAGCRVMGVVNVTPDSFSDGGDRFDPQRAIDDALAMWEAGAAILDVGGESTRPGAEPVGEDEELRRILPVIRALSDRGCRVSVDTRHARVMREAVAAGARLVNDVTALTGEGSLEAVRELGVPAILMHMQGTPQTMQKRPSYADVALDVYDQLQDRVQACVAAGIARERLVVDPGVGFGKTVQHNLELMNRLALFQGLGCPVMLGVSRKSTLGTIAGVPDAKDRMPGSLAAAVAGAVRGVQLVRVHDVAETVQALKVWHAIEHAQAPADVS